jgi:hypothetical protein
MLKLHSSDKTIPFLLIVSLLVLLWRLPYTVVNFWIIDESGYAAVADKLSTGHVLYKEASDNKPPFIFYFYAAVFSLFGRGNMCAVHIATLLITIIGLWLLHQLSAELYSEKIARISTVAYALYLVASPPGDTYAANTETYLAPAAIAGLYLCLMGLRTKNAWCWVAAGVLLGLAAWIKQPGILFCLAVPIIAIIDAYPFHRSSLYRGLYRCSWAFLGFCTVSLFWLGLLYRKGILHEFAEIAIFYNTNIQIVTIPALQSFQMAKYTASAYFKIYYAPIVLALIGLTLLFRGLINHPQPHTTDCAVDTPRRPAIILLSWMAISFVAVSIGGRFYGYYMYLLAPIVAVLVAVALDHFQRQWHSLVPLTRWSLIVFIVIGCVFPFYHFQKGFFERALNAINTDHKNYIPADGSVSTPALLVSRYAANTTVPGDQIFVWGYQPHIYVLSGRNFATRYFSVALQTGFVWGTVHQMSGWASDMEIQLTHPTASAFKPSDTAQWIYPGSQELLLKDLQSNPPELFIDGNVPGEWPFSDKYPIAAFPKFQQFLENNYKFEKAIIGYRIYRRLKAQSNFIAIATASHRDPCL